jgi:hypothetical protein
MIIVANTPLKSSKRYWVVVVVVTVSLTAMVEQITCDDNFSRALIHKAARTVEYGVNAIFQFFDKILQVRISHTCLTDI